MPREPLERDTRRGIPEDRERVVARADDGAGVGGEGHACHTGRVCAGAGDRLARGDVEEVHCAVGETVGERADRRG